MSTQTLDPFDTATDLGERAAMFFGKMDVNARFVAMAAGLKKTTWMEGDNPEHRKTEVELRLNPIDAMNVTFAVTKTLIAEFSDWSKIVWPSLRDLGIKNVREVNGKWAHIELVNGRAYKNKDGEDVTPTQMKFIALFDTVAECTTAYEVALGAQAHTTASNGDGATVSQPNDAEKAAAMQFLPHVVGANKGDLTKLAAALASMSPINKYFTIDSPEVKTLLGA